MPRLLTLFFALLTYSACIYAVEINGAKQFNLTEHVSYQQTNYNETPTEENYSELGKDTFNQSYLYKLHWFKIELSNDNSLPTSRVLYLNTPLNGFITFYNQDHSIAKETGSDLGQGIDGAIFHGKKLTFMPFEKKTIVFSLHTVHQSAFKILLTTPLNFHYVANDYEKISSLYMGAMLALIIYNFLMFASSFNSLYLIYCIFASSLGILTLNLRGLGQSFVFDNGSSLSSHLLLLSASAIIFFIEFIIRYLRPRKSYVKSLLFMRIPQALALVHILIYPFIDREIRTQMGVTIDLSIMLSFVAALFWVARVWKENPLAKFYLASLVLLIGCTSSYFLMHLEILPYNVFFANGPIFGNIFEMITIAIGIGYKSVILDKDKKLAQRNAFNKIHYQRLVRVLTHDIANGLTLVHGFAAILRREVENPRIFNKMNNAIDSVIKLTTLVREQEKNIIKEKDLTLIAVPVERTLSNALAFVETMANNKNIFFVMETDSLKDLYVFGEEMIIEQNILANVLTNAIKFSSSSSDIIIRSYVQGTEVILEFLNYGEQINEYIMDEILTVDIVHSKLGTQGEIGSGFGLKIIYDYMKIIGGSFDIKPFSDRKGIGTLTKLTFTQTTPPK